MKKVRMRAITETYCDRCGEKVIQYATVTLSNGEEKHFCSNRIPTQLRSCYDKYKHEMINKTE